jgi:hypothetical protein
MEDRESLVISNNGEKPFSEFDQAISKLGLEQHPLMINPRNDNSFTIYVTGSISKLVKRFALPQIKTTVASSWLRKTEEVIAGLIPSFATIPINTQQEIIDAFTPFTKDGEKVEVDGVIIPDESSRIKTIFGLDKNLLNPRFNIHFYDKEGNFIRLIKIVFIDEKTKQRINKINQRLKELEKEDKENFKRFEIEFQRIYELYKKEGLLERLISNEKSLGFMASDKGLTILDLLELLLNFKNERDFLNELISSNFKGLNLDTFKRKILVARYERYKELKSNELLDSIVPSSIDILKEAILLIQQESIDQENNQDIISYFRYLIDVINDGKEIFFHNIGRGILGKFNIEEFYDGKQHHFSRLSRILESGRLIPAKGAYSKGIYLSVFNPSYDSLKNFLNFLIQSYDEKEDRQNYTPLKLNFTLLFESLKNCFNSSIILELEMSPLPRFKHQTCSTCYTDISIERIKRIIVETEKDFTKIIEIFNKKGLPVPSIITLDRFRKELYYLEKARKQCFQKLGIPL